MTFTEIRRHCTAQLAGLYEAREAGNIVRLLLEHYTGYSASQLVVAGPQPVDETVHRQMSAAMERLLRYEPVQYILEEAWFYGRPFYVNRHVLIPRPETEELVERVLLEYKRPERQPQAPVILDVGTGSGCIPISLKLNLPGAEVWAIDISTDALNVAQRNAGKHQAAVNFLQQDFTGTALWPALPQFHIIVSNPPYIPLSGKADMQPNVVDYEPHTALFVPNQRPLLFYELLAQFGQSHLLPGGFMACEIHEDLGTAVKAVFETAGYRHVQVHKDMQGKERMVVAEKRAEPE